MNFVWIDSKNVAINADYISWVKLSVDRDKLWIKTTDGENFFIDDADEIEMVLDLIILMEFEDEEAS